MRTRRIAVAFLTVGALLLAGGASVFCAPACHGVMKCCRTAKAGVPAMKQPDCCRFVPASTSQVPAGVETSSLSGVSRHEIQGAALSGEAQVVPLEGTVEPQPSPPPVHQRELSVPLYLLNTSLLR